MKRMNPRTDDVMNDYEPDDEDEMGMRVVEYEGKTYYLKFRNPYGHCHISVDKGRIPDELSGSYTTQTLAETAIKQYHSKLKEKNV